MSTVLEYVLSHYLSIVHHCWIYFGPFPLKYHKIGVYTPYLIPIGVLMIAMMSYIDACSTWTHVGDLLTHYPPKFLHFRIYFGPFPLKYPKLGVCTPGFGPKRDLSDRKDAIYRCVLNVSACGVFANSLSTKISPFSNSFWTFSFKIP